MMSILDMSVAEFKHVEREIDTWYYNRYKNEKIIKHYMPNFIYYASNKGFHKYLFFDKIPNIQEKELDEWNISETEIF